jgi:hypothetical protein
MRRLAPPAKGNVGRFDQFQNGFAARDFGLRGMCKNGIPFDFGDGQQRLEAVNDAFEQFSQDFL